MVRPGSGRFEVGFWLGFRVGLRARDFPTEGVLSRTPLIIRAVVRFGEDASAPPLCGCSQSDSTADAGGVGGAWKGRAAPFLLPRPEGLHQHCTPRESSLLGDVRRFHGSGSGSSWWWCWWRRWWRLARGCYAGEWAGGAGGGGGRWAERHWRHGLRHWSVARGLGPATVPLFAC